MEPHSPVAAKRARLRSYLRVAFYMLRKGLISKRKLVMDMNLIMKRGKLMSKAVGNLVFHHHHRARPRGHGHAYGLQEYEFSCKNSPNPVFFHAKRGARHNYFPCISDVVEVEDEVLPVVHYSPRGSSVSECEEEEEEEEELENKAAVSSESGEVDDVAEEFIRRFHEQLRRQSRFALLQYEIEYQEMLARGL